MSISLALNIHDEHKQTFEEKIHCFIMHRKDT